MANSAADPPTTDTLLNATNSAGMALLIANSCLLRSDRCTEVPGSIVSGVDNGTASEAKVGATRYSTLTILSKRELAEAKVLKYRRSIIRWYSSVMRKEGKGVLHSVRKLGEAAGTPSFAADTVMDKSSPAWSFF
ncbi:MAG TPA: hypothetical protein VF778_13530 [Xanthobacteraceae bacterium]